MWHLGDGVAALLPPQPPPLGFRARLRAMGSYSLLHVDNEQIDQNNLLVEGCSSVPLLRQCWSLGNEL